MSNSSTPTAAPKMAVANVKTAPTADEQLTLAIQDTMARLAIQNDLLKRCFSNASERGKQISLQNPFVNAMEELLKDPETSMEKYKDLQEFFQDEHARALQFSPRLIKSLPIQVFFTDEEVPEMKVLRDNYTVIRNELEQLIRIGDVGLDVPDRIYRNNSWKLFPLYEDGKPIPTNTAKCPETTKIIEQFENLTELGSVVGFSNIYPGTSITPHTGRSNSRVRIHLGLIVPDNCFLMAGNNMVHWKEGEPFAFNDSFLHSVQNKVIRIGTSSLSISGTRT